MVLYYEYINFYMFPRLKNVLHCFVTQCPGHWEIFILFFCFLFFLTWLWIVTESVCVLCSSGPKHNCLNKQGNWSCIHKCWHLKMQLFVTSSLYSTLSWLAPTISASFLLLYYFGTLNAALTWFHRDTGNLWLSSGH